MNARTSQLRRLVPAGALALVAGVAGAQAAGGSSAPPRPAVAPAAAAVAAATPPRARRVPACRPGDRARAKTPPSEALKRAFGVLRRERTDADALPARAMAALRSSGLEPIDARSARVLRGQGAARAWVVPVPDAGAAQGFGCRRGGAAREGLAVVALGGAPAGGGGALRDLQRGLAQVSVDPCTGSGRDMLGVSGIVPDGVEAVFVTGPDGTATRADVRDNGFVFVLARPRRPEPRYVVWTGAEGTPHVQPLPPFAGGRPRCPRPVRVQLARVTPDPFSMGCGSVAFAPPLRVMPAPRRAAPTPSRRRPVPATPAVPLAVCPAGVGGLPMVVPGPAAALRDLRPALVPRAPYAPAPPRLAPAAPRPAAPKAAPPRAAPAPKGAPAPKVPSAQTVPAPNAPAPKAVPAPAGP